MSPRARFHPLFPKLSLIPLLTDRKSENTHPVWYLTGPRESDAHTALNQPWASPTAPGFLGRCCLTCSPCPHELTPAVSLSFLCLGSQVCGWWGSEVVWVQARCWMGAGRPLLDPGEERGYCATERLSLHTTSPSPSVVPSPALHSVS